MISCRVWRKDAEGIPPVVFRDFNRQSIANDIHGTFNVGTSFQATDFEIEEGGARSCLSAWIARHELINPFASRPSAKRGRKPISN